MPKLTNGNVTPVSGMTARLPATVTASWHRARTTHATADPAQERLLVVDQAPTRSDEARLAARDTCVVADKAGCSHNAQPIVNIHAVVQPNTPTSAVNV